MNSYPPRVFDQLEKEFAHPAVLLWRGVEISIARQVLIDAVPATPILDIGCAEGAITSILFPDQQVVGVDLWYEALHRALYHRPMLVPVQADARALPLPSGSIATVFSNSVLEHISGLDAVLEELSRVLAPDGVLVFTVPTAGLTDAFLPVWILARTPLRRLGRYYAQTRNTQLAHYNLLDEAGWRATLLRHNLAMERFVPYLSSSTVRVWDLLAAIGWAYRPLMNIEVMRKTAFHLARLMRPLIRYLVQRDARLRNDHCAAVVVARRNSDSRPCADSKVELPDAQNLQ